jgi:hypothetical protein
MPGLYIVTRGLKTETVSPDKPSIARKRPINKFPPQPKYPQASKIRWSFLHNAPLTTLLNDGEILGSGVFCVVRPEVA